MEYIIKDFYTNGDKKYIGIIAKRDAVYETVTKQRQKVVVSEVEEEVSSTDIVLEDGKYVQKTTTETVTKEVKTPQYEEVNLYDEDDNVIGNHTVPAMEDYDEKQIIEDEVKYLIDREVSISEGKSDKDYISDAFKALGRNGLSMEYEINDFFENYENPDKEDTSPHQNVGKKWDDEKKLLENK